MRYWDILPWHLQQTRTNTTLNYDLEKWCFKYCCLVLNKCSPSSFWQPTSKFWRKRPKNNGWRWVKIGRNRCKASVMFLHRSLISLCEHQLIWREFIWAYNLFFRWHALQVVQATSRINSMPRKPDLAKTMRAKWNNTCIVVSGVLNAIVQCVWQYIVCWWKEANFWFTTVSSDKL